MKKKCLHIQERMLGYCLQQLQKKIYNLVLRRFLAIFYPPAIYSKVSVITKMQKERFFTSDKVCIELGYLEVLKPDRDSNERESTKYEIFEHIKKRSRRKTRRLNSKRR